MAGARRTPPVPAWGPSIRLRCDATRSRRRALRPFALPRMIALAATLLALVTGCARGPASERLGDAGPGAPSGPTDAPDAAPLDAGWDAFMAGLAEARRGLEDPELLPPASTPRNLAEGHRYLLGHLARLIESETQLDPAFPSFQRSVRMLSKWTIDNPDTMYLSAAISADGIYRVRGRALDTSAWRNGTAERDTSARRIETSARDGSARVSGAGSGSPERAPRVVIFQTTTAVIGDTGSLAELASCRNQTLDAIDQFELEIDGEGRFELVIAAERPPGWDGPWLRSRGELPCPSPFGTTTYRLREATRLNVREIFGDWETEVPLELEIVRLDRRGDSRPPRTPERIGADLASIGRKLAAQIRFWNALHEIGLEVNGDRNGDGRRALPRNALNPPSPPFVAGGTAGAGQLYAAGVFDLAPDQALVVRIESPIEPHYLGFQLANLWGESLDQATWVSSQTGTQNPPAHDGARYYVVSAGDPGTPGWLATTGLPKGTMSLRFLFRENPPRERMPRIASVLTTLDRVREHLPDGTPRIDAAQRRRQIDARQRHIQRRWRQY